MDLCEDDVRTFAKQLQQGENAFFGGRWINPFDVIEVLIYQTEEHSNSFETPQTSASSEIFSQKKGMNVTRQYVSEPPKLKGKETEKVPKLPKMSENVFIVHGRNVGSATELAGILEGLKLKPIILSEQASGSRTIIEKLEKYSDVGYAFVILMPDDVGGLANSRLDLKNRARQNVILEFGYFMGLLGRDRVCCLYKGDIELPSDMLGVVHVQFNQSLKEVYWYIIKELRAVGYAIELP
jgi:predicted nucleotide-binding protein